MDYTFLTGLIGSLVVVTGAAWPEKKGEHLPTKSTKNWLFAIGGFLMFLYSIFAWLEGGAIFFVFLETMVVVASIMMMIGKNDKIESLIIILLGLTFIIWSLYLFDSYNTVFFIIGLSGIGLGYVFDMGTLRRSVALTIGSALIALFSYIEASWIFFWLNTFFAIFSMYYVVLGLKQLKK
ncbi:hypothetical protein HOG48_01345 [Candidatus Peregrinibacteria bacterium]|jgi:hypothetical protein|nr:hypothetical protein [Candidatus Peregrinibacteria bacterium]